MLFLCLTTDDRAVRDLERRAALLHFSSDQATLLTDRPFRPPTPELRTNPRVEHVRSLAKTPMFCKNPRMVFLKFNLNYWMFMVNVILYLWIGMLDVTDVVSLCCSTLNWLEWIDQLIGLE